ncbi:MAG: CocE/NonD family hydrolase [Bacteroidales bacterium]|jgi:putative CocE/NonD family hydrolase|nr:CocE/NonD family hydrolase [Bacteroidales bacterium]
MKLKKMIPAILSAVMILSFVPVISFSQSIEGDWHGVADIRGMQLRLSIHVKSAGDGYTSTWDSPDQGAFGIPSTTTNFTFPDFSFSHEQAGLKYAGKVNPDYTEITGSLEQGQLKIEIKFGRQPIEPPAGSPSVLKQKYDKQEVYITMRDGVKLFTSIYTPKNATSPRPVLLNRTPYNIEGGGPSGFNVFMQVYTRFTDDDYIMVFQDVRGKFMSEGVFEDIRPVIPVKKSQTDIDETTDTWDTVDWLVKNVKNNNGNIGIFGISYPGFYSTMGIINAHPAVKAVSPQAPVTDWFIGDDFHHNGAFFLLDCFPFYYSFGQPRRELSRSGKPSFRWPTPDNYEFFLSLGAIKNIAPKYFGDSIKFWNDVFEHPDYDDFWKSRDPRPHLRNVKPAVMTVGGWFDAEDLYGALHTYKAIETQNPQSVTNHIVMGPWEHSQWAAGEAMNLGNTYWGMDANLGFMELEKKFFDHHLKGTEDPGIAEASMFVTGSNEWRDFDKWPPANAKVKNLYFHPGEIASFQPPSVKNSFDEYISDPMNPVPYREDVHAARAPEYMTDDQRFASRRPDVMVYQTAVLEEDITVAGPVNAGLFVSTTGTDADYIVKLVDVFPPDFKPEDPGTDYPLGGYQMLVRGEVMRGKYRNSFEKPEPFVPGKVTEVKFELPDVAHTFKKGHRIMIQVQSSWFPLVDRNPQKFVNIYKCSDDDFIKATQRIYHDVAHPSHVSLGILQ